MTTSGKEKVMEQDKESDSDSDCKQSKNYRPKANVSSLASIEIGVCDTPYTISKQFFTKVWINEAVQVKVMLDSGSAGNFISPEAVQRCGLNTQPQETPLSVTHVQGGKVGLVTEQVQC